MSAPKETPWVKQYNSIKKDYKDAILLFRMGDFYEMFYNDAYEASKILGIALTKRRTKKDGFEIPMCGIPYHALDNYLGRLLAAGKKVAICEQLEPPSPKKKLVKRGVVRVITPGTINEKELLDSDLNNFLLSLYIEDEMFVGTLVDISTGDIYIYGKAHLVELNDVIVKFSPREILINRSKKELLKKKDILFSGTITPIEEWEIIPSLYEDVIKEMLGIKSLKVALSEKDNMFLVSLGMALNYIKSTQMKNRVYLKLPVNIRKGRYMQLSSSTVMHLELIRNTENMGRENTLYALLDRCKTPMGKRTLEKWILNPLLDKEEIIKRQKIVSLFLKEKSLKEDLENLLDGIGDIDRYITKLISTRITPQELKRFSSWVRTLTELKEKIESHKEFKDLLYGLEDIKIISEEIEKTIQDEPSSNYGECKIIKRGVSEDLDRLCYIKANSNKILKEYEEELKKRFDIPSLKIGYNDVFGYYIEVTKTHSPKVEKHLIKRQTLRNAERYTTEKLKKLEKEILEAEEKIKDIEQSIYKALIERLSDIISSLNKWSELIASIDVLLSFAVVSKENNYIIPKFNDKGKIELYESRHPVVEWVYKDEPFVPNDLYIDQEEKPIVLLTGPNMAGKSTFLRQIALIQIMAQIGSPIPAREGSLPIVDKIFTRIGAADYLIRGESTFLVEMQETAKLLKESTKDSLLILDEVGRGTSTYDGLSIAWAIVEYLIEKKHTPKTLFATHYHELTKLAKKGKIQNLNMLVKEENENIYFLRKVVHGTADKSYGIYVAKIAGLPKKIIDRATIILKKLEEGTFFEEELKEKYAPIQLNLFSIKGETPYKDIIEEIKSLDINQITPLEALHFLAHLKEKINSTNPGR